MLHIWNLNVLMLLVTGLFVPVRAFGEPLVALREEKAEYLLGKYLRYIEDQDGSLTFSEIRSDEFANKWTESKSDTPNFGYSKSVFWIRIDLVSEDREKTSWVLEYSYSQIDFLDIYFLNKDEVVYENKAGDLERFSKRPIKNRNFAYPFSMTRGEPLTVYMRVQSQGSIVIPVSIYSPARFTEKNGDESYGLGIFFGSIFGMILYNLFLYFKIRHKSYLYYITYIGFHCLFVLSVNGFSYQYLWPNFPEINNVAIPLFVATAALGLCLFAIDFLKLKENSPFLKKVVSAILVWSIAAAILSFLVPFRISVRLIAILPPVLLIATIAASIRCYIKGYRPARYFLLAFVVFMIGSLLYSLKTLGVIPANIITEYGMQIGSALEVVLLSFALGDRIRQEQKQAQQEIKQLNEGLERKVIEKTHEIRSLLDHIPQGVCSIETGAVLAKDYSAHLADILGTDSISGKNIEQLILSNSSFTIDEKDQVMQIINSVIGEDALNFELNCGNLPAEICYTPGSEDKYLKATWNVEVTADNRVQRILLTLLDVSNERVLEQKNKEQAQLLELVKELIDITAQRAAQFFATGLPLLQENQRIIDNAELDLPTLRLLFVNAHTVKGAARTLQLKSLAAAIHKAEDSLSARIKGAAISKNILSQENKKGIDVFNSYIYVNREKLNRSEDLTKITINREFIEGQYFIIKDLVESSNPTIHQLIRGIKAHSDVLIEMIFEHLDVIMDGYRERAGKIARDIGKPEPNLVLDVVPVHVNSENKVLIEKCMVHILRNALDHGLENAEVRRQKIKPENGTIHIKASVINGFLQFTIFDDGQGLAIGKLRKIGLQSGNLQAEARLEEIAEMIFQSGVSTSTNVSNISGRGVGMCAVRQFAEDAGGSCEIKLGSEKSEPGFYEFELVLRVPQQQYEMVGAA